MNEEPLDRKVEAEFYAQCCMYTSTLRPVTEGEQRCYVLIEVATLEEGTSCQAQIIDPGMPTGVTINTLKLNVAQQVILGARKGVSNALDESMQRIGHLRHTANMLGMSIDELHTLVKGGTSKQDFAKAVLDSLLGGRDEQKGSE